MNAEDKFVMKFIFALLVVLGMVLFSLPSEGQSAVVYQPYQNPRVQLLDNNGLPLSGGKLCTYAAGTTSPLATYFDNTGTLNANPVVLDAAGRATVYLGAASYKFALLTPGTDNTCSTGTVLWTQDNITELTISSGFILNVKILNSTRFAEQFPGADIGAKILAAWADCSNQCEVYVSAGNYPYATTITYPTDTSNGTTSLVCDPGAVLNYTGSGDAFTAIPTGAAPNAANVRVDGCTFVGTGSAANGIHTKVFNKGTFTNVTVRGFTGATSACVLNEGTNTVDYISVNLKSCGYAIRNVGVVYLASNYAANAINFIGGHMTGCVTRCVFEDASLSGTVGLNDGNHYTDVTIDGNNTQNVFIQGCNACTFQGGYQEEPVGSSVAHPFVVGDGTYTAYSLNVHGVVFASIGATNTIQLVRAQNAVIEGNSELAATSGKMVNLSANVLRSRIGINLAFSNTDLVDGVIDVSTTYWDPTNVRWQMPAIYSTNLSTFSAGLLVGADTIRPSAAGGQPIGTALLPFSGAYIGGSATNNAFLTGTFGQATVLNLPDPGAATATVLYREATRHGRNASVCTTGAASYNTCTTTVTFSGSGFADTAYTAAVSGVGNSDACVASIASKSTTAVVVQVQTERSTTCTFTELDVIALHD